MTLDKSYDDGDQQLAEGYGVLLTRTITVQNDLIYELIAALVKIVDPYRELSPLQLFRRVKSQEHFDAIIWAREALEKAKL